MLRRIIPATLYVKVMRDKFLVRHLESGREVILESTEPFSTSRLLVGEFTPAADTLRKAFRQVLPGSRYLSAPRVVMHQTMMAEGGLSAVEQRVLLEVADYAGAKRATVWTGRDLSDDEVKERFSAA